MGKGILFDYTTKPPTLGLWVFMIQYVGDHTDAPSAGIQDLSEVVLLDTPDTKPWDLNFC